MPFLILFSQLQAIFGTGNDVVLVVGCEVGGSPGSVPPVDLVDGLEDVSTRAQWLLRRSC